MQWAWEEDGSKRGTCQAVHVAADLRVRDSTPMAPSACCRYLMQSLKPRSAACARWYCSIAAVDFFGGSMPAARVVGLPTLFFLHWCPHERVQLNTSNRCIVRIQSYLIVATGVLYTSHRRMPQRPPAPMIAAQHRLGLLWSASGRPQQTASTLPAGLTAHCECATAYILQVVSALEGLCDKRIPAQHTVSS